MHTILTIIVAAGSGTRMGTELPKQFLAIGGEPIVMRTIRSMSASVDRFLTDCSSNVDEQAEASPNVENYVHKIVLVLPASHIPQWRELCDRHRFRIEHTVVAGGETRFHSVRNGLAAAPDADIVLVHDGVRPFADSRVVADVILAARRHGAAVPVVPVVDSLRKLSGTDGDSESVNRSAYRAVQTPQGFRGDLLRKAYGAPYDGRFTDDASVVELTGTGRVVLTEGNTANLKITTPVDLAIAEVLLR